MQKQNILINTWTNFNKKSITNTRYCGGQKTTTAKPNHKPLTKWPTPQLAT